MTETPRRHGAQETDPPKDRTKHPVKERLLLCISLTNLLFLNSWAVVRTVHKPDEDYYRGAYSYTIDCALLLSAAGLALAILAVWSLTERCRHRGVRCAGKWLFGALSVFAFAKLFWHLLLDEPQLIWMALDVVRAFVHYPGAFAALVVISIGLVWVVVAKWHKAVARGAVTLLLLLTPLAGIHVAEVAWHAVRRTGVSVLAGQSHESRPAAAPHRKTRILWLVFDEMDEWLAFEHRPAGLRLTELDRLRKESISATQVLPSADATRESMPSMIVGQRVTRAEPVSSDDLLLTFSDGRKASWRTEQNVFAQSRSLGFHPAVVGWYHPYCRILGSSLAACSSWECPIADTALVRQNFFQHAGILRSVPELLQAELQLDFSPDIDELQWARQLQRETFAALHRRGLQYITDPRLDFVLIHYPVPHPLGIFDRTSRQLSAHAGANYLDNLALVDHVVGQIRTELQRAGLWEHTTIVLTADHPFRDFWRKIPTWTPEMEALSLNLRQPRPVPLLVRLPRQKNSFRIDSAVDGICVHDLLLALMRKQLNSPEEAVRWLSAYTPDGREQKNARS